MQICPSFNKSLKKNLHKIVDITAVSILNKYIRIVIASVSEAIHV